MSALDSSPSPVTIDSQVVRDMDRIIDGLDYSSFELLPGTVNPRPGMRYIADSSAQFVDSEVIENFRTESVLIEDVSDGGGAVPYFLPSTPYWHPFLIDTQQGESGRKKKKNKKKRNKNRQRQLPYQFQLEVQVEQEQTQDDVSPPTSPSISDGSSTESPTNSPIKMPPTESPDKKGKKKRSKQRRRGSGRGRRLFLNPEDVDLMNVHLNGLNIGSNRGNYEKPETYSVRSPHGPSYLGAPPGPIYSRGPLWIPHPVIYSQC